MPRTTPARPTQSMAPAAPPSARPVVRKLEFPVADDFFPVVSLSLAQVQQYEDKVKQLALGGLQACEDHEARRAGYRRGSDEDMRWHEVAHDTDLTTLRCKQASQCSTRTFGRVTGDYRRFVDFFSADTSAKLFAWNQFFFGCAVDAAVLCNINLHRSVQSSRVQRKKQQRHKATLGIKWTCLQPSKLARKRDACFLEYVTHMTDSQGRAVAVLVNLPVDIPECPPLPRQMKTKREQTTTVTVVRADETNPGFTQLFMTSQSDSHALAASGKYCRRLLRSLKNVSRSADAKRIATVNSNPALLDQTFGPDQSYATTANGLGETQRPWVPKHARMECGICTRAFRAGRRRRHCHLCGDVFCTKCLVRRAAPDPQQLSADSDRKTFRVIKTRFCKVCVTRSREQDAEELMLEQVESTRRSMCSNSTESSRPRVSTQRRQTDGQRRSTIWTEDSRGSWWSEAESETDSWKSASCRFSTVSRNTSHAPTVRSSNGSERSTAGKNSFLTALEAMELTGERDLVPKCINEEAGGLGKRSSIVEVIDTKDMVPDSELQRRERSQPHSETTSYATDFDQEFAAFRNQSRARYKSTPVAPVRLPPRSNCRRTRSTDQGQPGSLDQRLAEQSEILRRIVMTANGGRHGKAGSTAASKADSDLDYQEDVLYEL